MRKCSKIIVGRIHGKAVGGGVGIISACDYALASVDAAVKLSELAIGIGPFVIEPSVSRKIGKSAMSEMTLVPYSWKNAYWAKNKGLYAEVLRRPGLAEKIQREHRVVLAGPTTLAALLNSLQMGFRTLAIVKRSSEVWKLLGAVKTDFSKFGEVLEKTKKKLQEASNTIDSAATASRRIERKLRDVEELPSTDEIKLIEPDEE